MKEIQQLHCVYCFHRKHRSLRMIGKNKQIDITIKENVLGNVVHIDFFSFFVDD